jgi:predicted ATPase
MFLLRRRVSWDAAESWWRLDGRWPGLGWSALSDRRGRQDAPGCAGRHRPATWHRARAWWVDLAEIRDAALVPNAVVAALDLRDQAGTQPIQVLLSSLRDSQRLLVLDNCEHVVEASARLVADVLRAAPEVRVVTTTREPLQVQGEDVVPVAPLGLPGLTVANRFPSPGRTKPFSCSSSERPPHRDRSS